MASIRYRTIENKDGTVTVEEIHKIVVYRFKLSDVEDPDLYAAEPIYNWQQTEQGKFIMEHSLDAPVFHKHMNIDTYGYDYAITAELEKKKLSEYYLKWGKI